MIAFLVEQGIGLVLVGIFVGAVVSDLTRPRASRKQASAGRSSGEAVSPDRERE